MQFVPSQVRGSLANVAYTCESKLNEMAFRSHRDLQVSCANSPMRSHKVRSGIVVYAHVISDFITR